jgi:hypothetical protein
MKRILILGFVLNSMMARSQDASVEKSMYGLQLGLVEFHFMNETKLERKIALRTEIGFNLVSTTVKSNDASVKDKTSYITAPDLSLEPRWYFGLDRRARLNRNIKNNSSNYLSLKTTFTSARTPITNPDNVKIVSALFVVPEFGIRRNFAKHFNYEFSGGMGYQYNTFNNSTGCNCNHNNVYYDIRARIGYDF